MRVTALAHRRWRLRTTTALPNLGDGVRVAACPLPAVALTHCPSC